VDVDNPLVCSRGGSRASSKTDMHGSSSATKLEHVDHVEPFEVQAAPALDLHRRRRQVAHAVLVALVLCATTTCTALADPLTPAGWPISVLLMVAVMSNIYMAGPPTTKGSRRQALVVSLAVAVLTTMYAVVLLETDWALSLVSAGGGTPPPMPTDLDPGTCTPLEPIPGVCPHRRSYASQIAIPDDVEVSVPKAERLVEVLIPNMALHLGSKNIEFTTKCQAAAQEFVCELLFPRCTGDCKAAKPCPKTCFGMEKECSALGHEQGDVDGDDVQLGHCFQPGRLRLGHEHGEWRAK